MYCVASAEILVPYQHTHYQMLQCIRSFRHVFVFVFLSNHRLCLSSASIPRPFLSAPVLHVTIWSVLAHTVVNLLLALFLQLVPSPPVLILPPSTVSLSSNFSGITSHTSHLFWCWLFLLRLSLHLPPPSLFLSSPLLRHAHLISVSTWVLLWITPPHFLLSHPFWWHSHWRDIHNTVRMTPHKLTKHWIWHYAEYDCCVMWFGSWNSLLTTWH